VTPIIHSMNWRKIWNWVGALLLALIPVLVAPWVNAAATGTPLNGVPGIARFWKAAIHRSLHFELWQVVVFLAVVAALALAFRAYGKRRSKTGLSIVVLSSPPPRWTIGAYAKTPVMFVHFHAQFAHREPHALRIVKIYLKGTECVAGFPEIVVTGPHDESVTVHTGVRPILSKPQKSFVRRAILVDQFGHKHRTEPICFEPGPNPIPHALTALSCHFCGQPVAMEDLAESAALFAHRKCVR